MKCQRQILGIRWSDFVSNVDGRHVQISRHLAKYCMAARRISVFGHIARIKNDVAAHMALRRHIHLSVGRPPAWS